MKTQLPSIASALTLALASVSHADILINEVDADQTSTDIAEFIELFDGGLGNQSLDGYSLVFYNGSNDLSYQAFSLDGYSTNNDGYFVLCGDATQVANCDLDVSPDSNLIQNGADAVALYVASASNFPTNTAVTTTALVDAVVYDTSDADDSGLLVLLNAGQPQLNENENAASTTDSIQRCGGAARDTDGFVVAAPTAGVANQCSVVVEPSIGLCGDEATGIHAIQGAISDVSNDTSPLLGQSVIVEAIVTADKQGGALANGDSSYQYSGFWLQQADDAVDSDPMTSEGVFVYDYSDAVNVGDRVRLQGTVSEYNQVTQISQVSEVVICASGQTLPAATTINLPVADLSALEALEGMRIANDQGLVVSDLFGTGYGFGNYGQFVVSSRLHFQGTEIALPGSDAAINAVNERNLDALLIDDGVSASYPSFIPFPDETGFSASNPMRIGYQVPAVAGVMHAYKNNYTIIPDAITIDPTHARTLAPVVAENANLVIVGMNVLNYFNGDGLGGGFPTSRGAPTADAFAMQSAKIVSALTAMNADIIGLMEIENDGYGSESAIQTLANELNQTQMPGFEYSIITPNSSLLGTDEIAVGLLYRAEKVTPVGSALVLNTANSPLDDNSEPLFDDTKNRPALIQNFAVNGHEITIAVNHLKSKGSACGEVDEGSDGQGNCNIKRTRAAQALVEFLANVESDGVMILGDLNAYSQEDPMQVFYAADFTNLKYTAASTEAQPYSYSFSGLLGSLDHALATGVIAEQVVSVDAWHINSVEDSLVDYLTEANGQTFSSIDNYAEPDAYRSSDHDPIVVGLNLQAPVTNSAPQQDNEIPVVLVNRSNARIAVSVSDYVSDADGDELTYSASDLPEGFSLSNAGQLTGVATPSVIAMLPLTVTIDVTDGYDTISVVVEFENNTRWYRLRQRWLAFLEWLRG